MITKITACLEKAAHNCHLGLQRKSQRSWSHITLKPGEGLLIMGLLILEQSIVYRLGDMLYLQT